MTKLDDLDKREAELIGSSVAIKLFTAISPEAGADAWIVAFPAIKELESQHRWFRPFIQTTVKLLLGDVGWGLKGRVVFGATMSMIDFVSDIYMFYIYSSTSQNFYSSCTFASLALYAFFLLFGIFLVHRKNKRDLAIHVLSILTFTKPTLDAYQVASGAKQKEGALVSPELEMQMVKVTEVFLECIPACLIQCHAYLSVPSIRSRSAAVSIAISALTTAYTSTTISYDLDTSPQKRKLIEDFYGFVPDSPNRRLVVFVFMIGESLQVLGALMSNINPSLFCHSSPVPRSLILLFVGISWTQVLAKSISSTLMMSVSTIAFASFMAADLVIYFIIKLVRRDFWYWIVGLGAFEIPGTVFVRLVQKVVTDFTLILQMRHPFECGGFYFTCNAVLSQATCYLSLYFFFQYNTKVDLPTSKENLWYSMAGLSILSLLFWGSFLIAIRRKYVYTFYSTETGTRYVHKVFQNAKDDEERFGVFEYNPLILSHTCREEIQIWIEKKIEIWKFDKPRWLTKTKLASIPEEYDIGNLCDFISIQRSEDSTLRTKMHESARRRVGEHVKGIESRGKETISEEEDDSSEER